MLQSSAFDAVFPRRVSERTCRGAMAAFERERRGAGGEAPPAGAGGSMRAPTAKQKLDDVETVVEMVAVSHQAQRGP